MIAIACLFILLRQKTHKVSPVPFTQNNCLIWIFWLLLLQSGHPRLKKKRKKHWCRWQWWWGLPDHCVQSGCFGTAAASYKQKCRNHKLQVPGLSYKWWGFQAWDTPQDSTDDSSIDMVETGLKWQEHFSQFQDTADVLPCYIHLPVCLWIMGPYSRAARKNMSHWNEMLLQDTTHLIWKPCYQRGSPCQDPPANRTTWRSLNHRKETQTEVVWTCLLFIGSGQNHLARHSESRKKTR